MRGYRIGRLTGPLGLLLGISLALSSVSLVSAPRVALAGVAAGCGRVIGSGITVGFGPNGYGYLASDMVSVAYARGHAAANDFAIFETHDPWGSTNVKDAITGAGHTYSVFTPDQLSGFTFSNYRVVVLNWDDTFLANFDTDYEAAIPSLESYVNSGGVVWVQGAVQGDTSDHYSMPFGGTGHAGDFQDDDYIVRPTNPLVAGAPSPLVGSAASHVSFTGLPTRAIVVATGGSPTGTPVEYVYSSGLPPAPRLFRPRPGTTGLPTTVHLNWSQTPCTDSFTVEVTEASTGQVVFTTTVDRSNTDTTALEPGVKYKWHVKACGAMGCTWSPTRGFWTAP
jgi:hypothetical protein